MRDSMANLDEEMRGGFDFGYLGPFLDASGVMSSCLGSHQTPVVTLDLCLEVGASLGGRILAKR